MINFFRHGRAIALLLLAGIALAAALSAKLLADTAELRYARDVNRMVFNDNLGVLEDIRARLGTETDSMRKLLAEPPRDPSAPYVVVSIADHRLWYKRGNEVLFTAGVATASGKELVSSASGERWRFETPRGRLKVEEKEENPAWVPPDWHFIEQAHKRGLSVARLERGRSIGGYRVEGSDIVGPGGNPVTPGTEGRELVVNGSIIIPPFGTNQRRYMGVLGTRRLKLGDGYAIHGTNKPETIGQSVSHGCIRMRNEDIEQLYPMVPVGTPVYVY
jgi:lipoprotein-anchoring transpeptidase ErfK/SrfK